LSVVHKIKHGGKIYVGKPDGAGGTVFDPPLPSEYQEACSDRLVDVFSTRTFPGLNTDTTFLANRGTLDKQLDDKIVLDKVIAGAKKQGYTPKPTDVYLSSLAESTGDPRAFVNGGDAKGQIRKICEERNVGCYGSVNIPQPERRVDPATAVKRDRDKAIAKRMSKGF
jgi:hypothetical protein